MSEKWNTDNTLGTEISVEDQLAKGLKLSFETVFTPQSRSIIHYILTVFKLCLRYMSYAVTAMVCAVILCYKFE